MATNKTSANDRDPEDFIRSLEDGVRKTDASALLDLFAAATGEKAVMWGDSIVGFGTYRYDYASGRSGTWMRTGFSPRKQQTTVYVMPGFESYSDHLAALGPHTLGKSCLYIKRLEHVDSEVLTEIVRRSYEEMGETDE